MPFGVYFGVSIVRPVFYQDFVTPGDSLYAVQDNVIVDEGARDSVAFGLARCAGTVTTLSRRGPKRGNPVPATTAAFYTSTKYHSPCR